MGFIYNGVCYSLVDLYLWQQVTKFAAVMHTVVFHPVDMRVYQNQVGFHFFLWICVI
jgi:hypothetical protein